ncbi:hypothetical protein RJ55_02123 [Drechmeria coniospora]|nr:hypothetical protein RJ55_02123 [Drechmeria coniospora]
MHVRDAARDSRKPAITSTPSGVGSLTACCRPLRLRVIHPQPHRRSCRRGRASHAHHVERGRGRMRAGRRHARPLAPVVAAEELASAWEPTAAAGDQDTHLPLQQAALSRQ